MKDATPQPELSEHKRQASKRETPSRIDGDRADELGDRYRAAHLSRSLIEEHTALPIQRKEKRAAVDQDKAAAISRSQIQSSFGRVPAEDVHSVAGNKAAFLGVASPAGVVQRKRAKGFDALTNKKLKEGDAPKNIVIPDELADGMQDAWNRSFPAGKPIEQGGVMGKRGSKYGWHGQEGDNAWAFEPDEDDLGKGEKLAAAGHTHPYASGLVDVSFSGGDMRSLVSSGAQIEMVQSGETRFLIARTAKFNKMVDAVDGVEEQEELEDRLENCWEKAFKAAPAPHERKCHEATKATCKRFHLIYYVGRGTTMTRLA